MKDTSVIVFGGSGFLGSHLIQKLNEYGVTNIDVPTSTQCDLMKFPFSFWDYRRPADYIFLCTNWFRPGNFNVSADEFINNSMINNHVLWYWKNYQPQATLVTFGSDAAYDPRLCLREFAEIKWEENYLSGPPASQYYSYGLTKRFLYQGLIEIHKQTQSQYLHFPLISLFGKNFKLNDEHLMHSIIKKITHAKFLNERAVFWGNGMQTREVSFVEDIVDNILQLTLIQERKNDIFNIGSNKRFLVRSLVEQVCQHLNYDINDVVFDSSKSVVTASKIMNSDKVRAALLSQYKDTPMKECIEQVSHYYCKSKFPNC